MVRGPIPKPTALRLIDGDRESRINRKEPQPRSLLPEPPPDMSPGAKEVWDYTVRELEAMKIATSADRDTLACYCEAVVNHRKASQVLAKSNILIQGIHGNPVRNPAIGVQRNSAQIIRVFAQEFGLTPSARSRIENHGDDGYGEDNPFAAGQF